ncbi:MAG: DUF4335 domain-containing protein [Cyanobacteria bacterium J06632_22]
MKRQYVLPSCSLTLEGIGTDATPSMSILANAECQFMGIEQRLSGGLEFFQALVEAVSHYAQGMLSSAPQPTAPEKLVRLAPAHRDAGDSSTALGAYHSLTVAARPDIDPALQEETALTLSTVQLFDLTDAVDQFLADTQTLPELSLQVRSRPRRDVKSTEPVAERIIPPLLGAGALAAAAAGLFMLPIPEVPEFDPESIPRSSQPGLEAPDPGLAPAGAGPEGTGSGDVTIDEGNVTPPATEDLLDSGEAGSDGAGTGAAETNSTSTDDQSVGTPQIVLSSAALEQLQGQLETQLTDQLPDDATFDNTLAYEVSVAENGDIVGYEAVNRVALDAVEQTPLPALTYLPVEDANTGAAVPFTVRFEPDGNVAVEPVANAVTDEPSSGVESETDEDLSE